MGPKKKKKINQIHSNMLRVSTSYSHNKVVYATSRVGYIKRTLLRNYNNVT